jgi:hypothetical protein
MWGLFASRSAEYERPASRFTYHHEVSRLSARQEALLDILASRDETTNSELAAAPGKASIGDAAY